MGCWVSTVNPFQRRRGCTEKRQVWAGMGWGRYLLKKPKVGSNDQADNEPRREPASKEILCFPITLLLD